MGLPFLMTRRRQGIYGNLLILERPQRGLDLLITGLDPRLVAVVELKRLTQSKHMLTAVVTGERCSYRLFRRFAACIAVGGQHSWIMLTGNNRSHDLHPSRPGNVREHVMQLQIPDSIGFSGKITSR